MDHNNEMAGQRPSLLGNTRRKSSLSDRLNKFAGIPFGRRRTSNVLVSSESSSSLRRRSHIPTPSLGSRTSTLFNAMKLDSPDDAQVPGIQEHSRKASQERQSTISSRRHLRLPSDSTSSFFGNATSRAVYPKEFLDNSETGTAEKENENRTSRHTEDPQGLHQLPEENQYRDQKVINEYPDIQAIKNREINRKPLSEADRTKRIESATPITTKHRRSGSDRLTDKTVSKLRSVRHSLAAVPESWTPKSNNRESGIVIEERRLMAPIDPPLPRSTTTGAEHNTSSAFTSPYHISPRTPNFMRPTSSSAARRTQPLTSSKPPPPPLNPTGGANTDKMFNVYGRHRRKQPQVDLGARRISRGTHLGLLPGNGLQMMANNRRNAIMEQPAPLHGTEEQMQARHNVARGVTPPQTPNATPNDGAVFNHSPLRPQASMRSLNLYPVDRRHASSPELRADLAPEEPPLPRIPPQFNTEQDHDANCQQLTSATNQAEEHVSARQGTYQELRGPYHGAGHVRPSAVVSHSASEQSISSEAGPNESKNISSRVHFPNEAHSSDGSELPRSRLLRLTSGGMRPQQTVHPDQTFLRLRQTINQEPTPTTYQDIPVNTSGSPSTTVAVPMHRWDYDSVMAYYHANDVGSQNWKREQARLKSEGKFSPRKAQQKIKQLFHSNFSSVELGNCVPEPYENATEDSKLVSEAQDLRYWAGRFTANNDRLRNEGLNGSIYHWARQETVRHNKVLDYLQGMCTTMEAEESLAAFVRAWRGGWSGGLTETCKTTIEVVPKQLPAAEKKKGVMGKMFGKK